MPDGYADNKTNNFKKEMYAMVIEYVLIAIGIILLFLFTAPTVVFGIFNTGNYIGIILACIFLSYGIYFKKINAFLVFLATKTWGKLTLICFFSILLALLVFAIIITVNIIKKANRKCKQPTTAVVLGCRVRRDGASTMLKTRLNATLEYLNIHPEANCVLSGGQGSDEPMSEGLYMFNWLTERGIDKKRLYIEDKSTSTEENISFSKEIIKQNNLNEKITIITNGFHQYRAYRFAKENGIESYSYSAKTPFLMLPTYYVREICGVAHMIFIG